MEKEKPSTLKNLLFLGSVLLVLFLYIKNKYLDSTPPQDISADSIESVVTVAPEVSDAETTAKLNVSIVCINQQSNRVFDSYYRYLSWVDKVKGPTGKESNVYGVYSLYDYTDQARKMQEAWDMEPHLPMLDSAGKVYIAALANIYEKVEEVNRYYEHEDYKDDAFAKAKEFHQPLVTLFDEFAAADLLFRNTILELQAGVMNKEIIAAREAGDTLNVLALNMMMLAQDLMKVGSVVNPLDVKLSQFNSLLDSFKVVSENMLVYTKMHKGEEAVDDISSLMSENDEFLKNAKDLMRRVRDKKPYEMGEKWSDNPLSGWMITGSPFELLDGYDDLVERYNSYIRNDESKIQMLTGTLFHVRGPV
ncbi:MAG: YiiG family protein [Bacteroidia bacterium]